MLNASDILDGARSSDASVFVVGAFDSRITFFSQQVRGLELAYALKDQGHLRPNQQIAVVGGGAAGVAAAAGLALLEDVQVTLFEAANELMMLQGASTHRRLDPHIYDWPSHNTADEIAGLPILDWRSGSARRVCEQVRVGFGTIRAMTGGRIVVRTRHTVTAIARERGALQLRYRDEAAANEEGNAFDLVILAFGFGMEVGRMGLPPSSYWDDAGVPGPELGARPEPHFLISGDGDGALIDLVAAANREFSHEAMLQTIVNQPGMGPLSDLFMAIDREGQAAAARGDAFDYFAAYDARLLNPIENTGLPERLTRDLRPGVRISWQTLNAQPFHAKTATLNRLAAYLVIKGLGDRFRHLQGPMDIIAPPAGSPADLTQWVRCDGAEVGVHRIIIRHGPDRVAVRTPFDNLFQTYSADHERWLARFGDLVRVPRLSEAAFQAITRAATARGVPPAAWRAEELLQALPLRMAVQRHGADLAWSGDIPVAECVRLWPVSAPRGMVYAGLAPQDMPATAVALMRLCVHAGAVEFKGEAGPWRAFADVLTTESPHGREVAPPPVSAGAPEGVAGNVTPHTDTAMALHLHSALDLWVLGQIHLVVDRFIQTGVDPRTQITIQAHPAVRQAMVPVWAAWKLAFERDPVLLARFLRLMVCAQDNIETTPGAVLLIGPKKLTSLIRATAIAVMVAASWTETQPAAVAPGNITKTMDGGANRSVHACGADMIERQQMALQAAKFMWATDIVLLPMIDAPIEIRRMAEGSLTGGGRGVRLTEAGPPAFMVTANESFREAAGAGLDALSAYLRESEEAHFSRLQRTVTPVP